MLINPHPPPRFCDTYVYDDKCFCGYNYDDYTRHGELVAADSCTMVCTGDPTEFCGGWNAISVCYCTTSEIVLLLWGQRTESTAQGA